MNMENRWRRGVGLGDPRVGLGSGRNLPSKTLRPLVRALSVALLLAGCGGGETVDRAPATSAPSDEAIAALAARLSVIEEAVVAWSEAKSIEAAQIAAETAANLVVGPNGPDYGDRNGDGVIGGESGTGLLPGVDGTPAGLASPASSNPCVARDVLGGSWEDPQAAWGEMRSAIDAWEPGNNTMPSLPSHPMRVVGWATFTLASDSIELAHEYASHARLHVDISANAVDC